MIYTRFIKGKLDTNTTSDEIVNELAGHRNDPLFASEKFGFGSIGNFQIDLASTTPSLALGSSSGHLDADLVEAAVQFDGAQTQLNSQPSDLTGETVKVDAGGSVELTGAYAGSVAFAGSTGTLILDHSSSFVGTIFNLTGDGNPLSSDQIDLKDIAFGSGTTVSYTGDSSGGVLTVSDAQDHVARLSLAGNYTNSTFNLSSDGHGGTTVIDPPVTPYALGVDAGNPNIVNSTQEAAFEANFNSFSALMGTKPQYLDQFGDQTQPISQWVAQSNWDASSVAHSAVLHNITPVIGLPMSSTAAGSGTADQFYKAFAAGTYDSVLQGMVKAWAGNGFTTQIWRPGWEMNATTMPSYAGSDAGTQADWVKAFQHIYTVLHAAGQADGVNIQVMWNPSVMNYSPAGNAIQTVYPGNQYVDIIGADVYGDLYPYGQDSTHPFNWDLSGQVLNSSHPVYSTLQQWALDPINLLHYYTYPASNQWSLDGSAGHATTLQQLLNLAKATGKPFAIPETGAGNTGDHAGVADNPIFVQWLSQTLQQSGVNISFVNIWDSNGGGTYQFSNVTDNKPLEAAAWARYFGAVSVAAPTVTSFSPDSNVVGDGITNTNKLTLAGTAIAGDKVEVFDGAIQIGVVTADANGSWSLVTGTLVDGAHSFTAQTVDAVGNLSAPSNTLKVSVDTAPPAAPIIKSFSPDSNIVGDGITNANHVTVTGSAEAGSSVVVFDGATRLGTVSTDTNGNWSFATGALIDGSHIFTTEAVDAAGNASTTSSSLKVVVDTVAPSAPVILSDQPAPHSAELVFGTAEAGSTVKLYEGSTYLGVTVATSGGAWSITTGSLTAGSHLFTATATDSAGNTSALSAAVDPVVGTLIESAGNASLTAAANNFYISYGAADVLLKYRGTSVTGGQFGGWTPIGAEKVGSGYDITWKVTGQDSYSVWSTDSTGNYIGNVLGAVSGSNSALMSFETTFQQDFNGDGIIGTPAAVIESTGTTTLTVAGSNFHLSTSGSDTTLKYHGVAVSVGQFGGWTPTGAETVGGGYDIAWKMTGQNLYSVWSTDSTGNYIGNVLGAVSGSNPALIALETTFQQDLNGDGTIGLPTVVIETAGATTLSGAGSNFHLSTSGSDITLKYNGVAVSVGQFGGWTPIGSEKVGSGYDIAWKMTGQDLYSVWSTDSTGNYTGNVLGAVSGSNSALKSYETIFQQDFNGDGVINTPSTVLDISGKTALALSSMSQPAKIEPGASLELSGAVSGSITFVGATGTLVLDHSTQFTGAIYGLTGNGDPSSSDILDLRDITFGSGTNVSYSGNTSGGVLTVSDAQNHAAQIALVGDYTHSTFNLASDGSGGTLVIDPPKDQFDFGFGKAAAPEKPPLVDPGDAFVFARTAIADLAAAPIPIDNHGLGQGIPQFGYTDVHHYLLHV